MQLELLLHKFIDCSVFCGKVFWPSKKHAEIFIHSQDEDLLQLVSADVYLLATRKDQLLLEMHHLKAMQADALGAQLAEASAAAEGHRASRTALKAAEHSKNEARPSSHSHLPRWIARPDAHLQVASHDAGSGMMQPASCRCYPISASLSPHWCRGPAQTYVERLKNMGHAWMGMCAMM